MGKFRKKPVVIEATQWHKNGDHPLDQCVWITPEGQDPEDGFYSEGKIVRRFRLPNMKSECDHCKKLLQDHGWIDTLEGGHIVCPGDWVITGVKGEHYPCKPDIFEATYEAVSE